MKKHLLFNQSFGMVGSPNQTGETLSRENRIGLMSYLRRTLMLLFAVLTLSIANIGMAWGADFTVNSSTTSSDALFSVSETMTNYTYSGYWDADDKLISMTTSSSITITNVTGATITAISVEGVADNNSNKTVNFTGSDGTTSAVTSSGSWNNRKSSSLTSKALNSTNVNKFKCGAGQTYTMTNNASSSYNAGVRFIITYTSTLPTSLTNGATTENSQTVSWTAPSTAPANGYLVAYSTSSTAPGNSVTSTTGSYTVAAIAAGTTSTTISGLSESTTYYWWVRSKNARGNSSWVAGSSFTTDAAPAGSTWYVKGGWNSWGTTDNLTGSGTELSATVNITTAGLYEFKIWNSDGDTWYGNTGNIGCNVSGWTFSTGESANCKFFASETGNYTFTFNTSTKALSVTYPTAQGKYYYKNTNSWGAVAVYRFKGGINNGWPGTQVVETETICGDTYYFTYADPGTTIIFTNNNGADGQPKTGDMAASGNAGKYVQGTESSWNTFPTYTVTYNANGDGAGNATGTTGSVPTDSNSPYACGSTVTVLGNTGSLAKDGYNFIGWNTAPGGGGTSYVADATFTISANTTLYAQWELIPTYDVIYNTNGGTGGSTASQTGNLSGAQVTTSANGFTKTGYKFKWWNTAANGSGEDFYPGEKVTIASADVNLYAQWEQVSDGWEFWCGSPNAFTTSQAVVGDMVLTKGGANVAINTDLTADPTIVSKYNSSVDKHAICIAVANNDQYVQVHFSDGSPINSLKLWATTNQTSSKKLVVIYSTTADFSSGQYEAKEVSVPANNAASKALTDFSPATADKYFYARIYRKVATAVYEFTGGSGNTARIYGVKAQKGANCSTPAAPTAFTAGSITTTGATFSITDAADAASYDIYYSTSSSTPGSSTPATTTSTSKTKAVTGLTAGTTYYAWVRSVCDASHKSAWVALNPGGDTHTFATSCVAPTTVNVTATVNEVSGYWFYPDDDVVLTAAPTGSPAGSPVTYQWKKNGSNVGTNSATLTINDAAASDAGKYTCTISYGECSTTSAEFSLKCMQFYLKNSSGGDISNHALQKVDATHATLALSLTGGTTYNFRVTDGCNDWYGNSDATGMTSSNCTNWTMPHDADCKVTTSSKSATYTFNFDFSAGLLGSEMKVSVVYPAGDQAAGKVIYWDNNVLNWASAPWYRIGKGTHNNKTQMTLVPGTAKLYKITTAEYNGFEYWHIANNDGNGTGNIFWTKGDAAHAITAAMGFEGSPVTADAITVTPTAGSHGTGTSSDNDNCEFYEYGQQNGMKTDRVTISDYSNGTITVNYVNTSDVASNFTSGYQDLAHTVKLTSITAVANTGYDASAITINGGAYSANYVVTGATTIAASFTPHVYSITYKDQGNVAFSGTHTDTPSAHPTSHTYNTATNLNGATKAGYTFGGWYTNSACTGDAVTSLGATDYTADITLYAKWTAAASLTALECNTLYKVADMVPASITLSETGQYGAGLSANTKFEVIGDPADAGNAGGTPEMKNEAAEFAEQSFAARMYLKGASNTTGSGTTFVPTSRAVKFIVSESGTLDIYAHRVDRLYLKKVGDSGTTQLGTSTSGSGSMVSHNVTAGTYYIYATGNSTCVYGVRLNCCTTPAAPTAFSAGSITSTGATFSITDAGNAASYDIYYSTSSDAPTASTPATTTSTSKTKAVTGLTASTTYYAWVRSVCDADHKSAWVALSGSSFETSPAAATPILSWALSTNVSTWTATPTNNDETNLTDVATSTEHADIQSGATSGKTCKISLSSSATPDKYVTFTFKVACGKKLTPSSVWMEVANVGGSSGGKMTHKAEFSDNFGHTISATVVPASDGVLNELNITNGGGTYFQGDVTLKVWAWNSSGTNGTAFRMGPDVKIFGEVGSQATPSATITWNTQPANGRVGDPDFAYDVTCSDGSTVTVTSANTTYATIVGGKLHYAAAGTTHLVASATDACGNVLTPVNSNDFTVSAAAPTYSVTHSLTNVTATSGATGAGAATEGVAYNAVFAANSGYVLPSTITVTIGGSPATVGTGYTWNASTGAFQVPAAQVTGAIVITIAGETAPATKDIYYGQVKITDGALVREIPSGTIQFFTNIGGTVANNTEISLSSTPSTTGMYYNSNNLTDTELSKSSNWSTSSGSNRYIRGLKFANGTTYTLALGTKVASAITFYGWCGSASKVMTIGGEEYTSSSTKNTFAKHVFSKSGGFTGNVTITEDGDFYGILVITIQTATPCTTPVIPALSNQSLCEGTDIAEWDATQTAVLADGETVTYSWKKKGNDTELANTATFDLGSSATESQAGTYVVTVTVSKAGKASSSAYREVELSVTEGEEVTSIVADKATVYPGNSVTLTATANTPATWQWYTCTNSAGDGEDDIDGATSASYTIASAGAAGTYYYKAKATGSCGTAERVYTLTVSPAAGGDCFHFVSVIPGSNINISSGASIVTPTHATTLEGGTMTVGSQQVVITAGYGLKMEGTKTVSITLDAALVAGNVVIVKGTSGTKGYGITINGVNFYDADNKTFDVSYTVLADDGLVGQTALTVSKYSGNSYLQEVKITGCGASCTDPEVTASADNTTACVGSSVTFTAANAHASATYQWQKLDGTWTNISGADASTYTIPSVVAGDAGKYRVIATHDCSRTSNEVTLSVPSAPDFGSTVPASVSVMQTIALSINTVEATDAVKYRWYKSADATWDAGDVEIGTNKELIKAYDSEAIGSPSYYIFCRAQNACGITTSTAIEVNVTAYVEEDCATRGNEGDAAFGFEYSASQATYNSTACWSMNDNSKKLIYAAPEGKYFKTMKVTIASSSASKASYNWSTNGGTTFTEVAISSINTTLTEKTFDLSAHGNVNALQIGRNLDGKGESSGTLYVSKICFEYTDACTATTVTPSTASTSYEMGGEWSNPTFTLTPAAVSGETLTYSSSNEDIASVDDDGTVTFNGDAGTVTITASYAGGTISATDYCASSGSYTINVSCTGGAPKVVASGTTVGCSSSITLQAKQSDGTSDFADGTYQWFRNGEEIDGATSSSYTATQAGTYTVERTNTSDCTTPSTNSAIVTSETTEPEVERLVPFQYYHVDKTYSDQMKMRHLFAVKNSGKLDGKSFKMYVSRNGGAATDVTSSNALVVWPNGDGHVDTVMVDLNKLSGKYSEDDELVYTCKAIDCSGNVSDVYKETITMNVIGATPTLALICSGSSKAGGTRKTGELTVGGDFLTGYNVADLCQQTGNTSFDANTEWGLYTDLKTQYIVTPVNGYAVFNKLNYEPFDVLLLTDYPKASKSDAAADVLDDMAALCDYRPMLSFKTHMVAKSPSKWAAKGFTTSPVVTKADGRLNLNIVCYAHPMFEGLKSGEDVYTDVGNTSAPLVYTMLSGTGYESSKGMQGFEIAAAENFVTIGLTHYNATITKDSPETGEAQWASGSEDRMLVTVAERQANPEARFILFSLNCGAQSKLTDKGEEVILACLNYLLETAEGTIEPADCSFTFDNGENNEHDDAWYASNCPLCTGTKGDGKWTTAANWGPDYRLLPGEFNSVRIKKPVEVNDEHAHVMDVRIIDEGSIDIPAGKGLDVKSTIRRMDGSEIYPTEENDIHIGSASTGNGTLIFNNDEGDTKARVDMYSKGKTVDGVKHYQYIGTPFNEINALYNYYGARIYSWNGSGWTNVKNGGPMTAWTGYCISSSSTSDEYYQTSGTLTATTTKDITVLAGANMVIGNSWTAPIDIKSFTDDDFENLIGNVYFFNTGVDKDGDGTVYTKPTDETRWAAGTYASVPIHAASYTDTDDHIPSLQGFFVKSSGSAGTLHLDYERHVRKTTRDNILSGQMHAPRRTQATDTDEPVVLKMKVSGENYDDKLVLLGREDFSEGFDNGWDGDKWDGNESALYIYTTDNNGTENSVSAIPELEGTIIGFRAGEDDAYTLNFEYLNSDEPLYLYDVENNTYTQIMTGMTYRFFTTDNEKHARFIITRTDGSQVATGIESTSGSLDRSKAKKLLIEDKMFIIVNGMLYDATGKVVK